MIRLPWPVTDNRYYATPKGLNRRVLSKRGRAYKDQAILELIAQDAPQNLSGEVTVFIRAYPPDRRKRDLTNILKCLNDCLEAGKVFADDYQISDLRIQRFNPSKPGRVEILVYGGEGK